MSYEVIARKWRPKNFNELIGQKHISQTLVNSLKNNRTPQALLFNGPRGTGKTSSARIFASTLRCTNLENYQACGQCSECQEISQGKSVNVIEVDGASNNGVDSVRELKESVSYLPPTGKYKVYIIDEVHMLSTSAFNALLKTLEEPPAHVVFILATTELHKVPNTILSRCQKYDFRRINTADIVHSLKKICDSEQVSYEDEAIWDIARQGDGSMRDSQSLLDQVISFCDNNLTQEQTIDALGLTNRKWVVEALKFIVNRHHQDLLTTVQKISLSGQDPNLFVKALLQEIRNTLIFKLNPDSANQIIDLSQVGLDELADIADQLSEEDLHLLFDITLKGAEDVIRSSSSQTVLEMLLLKLASAPRIKHIESLSFPKGSAAQMRSTQNTAVQNKGTSSQVNSTQQETQAQKKTVTKVSPPFNNKTAPPEQNPSAPPARLKNEEKLESIDPNASPQEQWNQFVNKIKSLNPIVAAKLEHSYLINKNEKEMTIGYPTNMQFLLEQAKDKEFIQRVQNYISTLWGKNINISFTEIKEKKNNMSPRELQSHKKQNEEQELRNKIENHPVIKEAHKLFKTEILSIKDL